MLNRLILFYFLFYFSIKQYPRISFPFPPINIFFCMYVRKQRYFANRPTPPCTTECVVQLLWKKNIWRVNHTMNEAEGQAKRLLKPPPFPKRRNGDDSIRISSGAAQWCLSSRLLDVTGGGKRTWRTWTVVAKERKQGPRAVEKTAGAARSYRTVSIGGSLLVKFALWVPPPCLGERVNKCSGKYQRDRGTGSIEVRHAFMGSERLTPHCRVRKKERQPQNPPQNQGKTRQDAQAGISRHLPPSPFLPSPLSIAVGATGVLERNTKHPWQQQLWCMCMYVCI